MHITPIRNHKGRYGLSLLLLSGTLYAAAIAEEVTEESPVCPGRPLYVQPTEKDVAEMGLSREILCIIADTYLFRHDLPGPDESPDLLRRYLRQGPYEHLSDAQYRAVMEEAVRLWPQSRYAHAGLAQALLAGHGIQGDPADVRRAAEEFLIAAEIAFSEGKVRYVTELAQILADLGDKAALDRYFNKVFELLPEGEDRYISYLDYAQALAKLGDERAETYFRKAIAVSPKGVGDAYEFYSSYLLKNGKPQAVLDLLTPDFQARRVMSESIFHSIRCRALQQLGREVEAAIECQQARDLLAPPNKRRPLPSGRSERGAAVREPYAPPAPGLLARVLGIGPAYAAHSGSDDCRTNFGCARYPGDSSGFCSNYLRRGHKS